MSRTGSTVLALAFACLVVATAPVSGQDWRGVGRLAGKVTDETGAPLEGVSIKAHLVGSKGGPEVKTNGKGEWVLAGINGGQWQLEVAKPGYETRNLDVPVAEHSTNAPVSLSLKKSAAAVAAAADPNVEIREELVKAADLVKQQKYPEARAIYESILQKHPQAYQVEPYIARTYYAQRQLEPAIEHLRAALAKDSSNIEVKLLLAQVLAEKGDADESRQLVASIDEAKITDPSTLLNIGIGMLNLKKPDEALTWFEKTVARFPQYADGYYYRGITELQLAKTDAARADLTKFIEMAPAAPEAATAKGILDKIKPQPR
jgi:tetratricopeptide (TPR) repeat protein